jgi:hypothetical protein
MSGTGCRACSEADIAGIDAVFVERRRKPDVGEQQADVMERRSEAW